MQGRTSCRLSRIVLFSNVSPVLMIIRCKTRRIYANVPGNADFFGTLAAHMSTFAEHRMKITRAWKTQTPYSLSP